MKSLKLLPVLLLVFLTLTSFESAVLGQAQEDKSKSAAMNAAGLSVRWEVASPSGGTLTISAPDGRVFRKEISSGAAPEFTAVDQGEKLPDGVYTFELRMNPSSNLNMKALIDGRGKDDDAESIRAARKRVEPAGLVQSGSFAIVNGAVVVAGATEENGARVQPAPRRTPVEPARTAPATGAALSKIRQHHMAFSVMPDQVIPDDLIVQGSACVGFDCVNNETFNFDTIRLKENNTRLHFDDTSSTAGFATNNWQIRANSSANGGGSFLAFVDQGAAGNSETGTIVLEVDAGAPANSLRVSSTGRLGLRTATPVLDVHMNTSDTPAVRFEQNNAGGFSAQTWDIGANEANFFVRDVTSGSRLPFRIRPGAPTSSIDISSTGKVGVGLATPIHQLDVAGNMTVGAGFNSSTNVPANGMLIEGGVGIGTTSPDQTLTVNGGASKPGGGSWSVFSDERLKLTKGQFRSGLHAVMQLQPIRYEYKKNNPVGINSAGEHIGFAAQAVQKVIPEAVTQTSSGYLQVNNDPIIWTMLNAIKEQQAEIEKLKLEVRKLRSSQRQRR